MKVIIVDDSIVYRTAIKDALSNASDIEVVKTFSNGKLAVEFLRENSDIDVMTLDMEMPVLNGLETIKELRKFNVRTKIIVFSSVTLQGAELTLNALSSGADDFITKVEGSSDIQQSIEGIKNELLPRIQALKPFLGSSRPEITKTLNTPNSTKTYSHSSGTLNEVIAKMSIKKPDLLCIGCSTGGPDALSKIFSKLNGHKLLVPGIIVQHMPPLFTDKLAQMLTRISGLDVREAKNGDVLKKGSILIAPGDYHLEIKSENGQYVVMLNQNEKVCHVRPSVDVTWNSLSHAYSGKIANFILTGMGADGANGTKKIAQNGSYNLIQSKESSVVWGMPGAVHELGIGSDILDLEEISEVIKQVMMGY